MRKDKLKYYCKCGKKIHWCTALYRGGRCNSCAQKLKYKSGFINNKGKNNPNYIDGRTNEKKYCVCGKELCYENESGLCGTCAKTGVLNPNYGKDFNGKNNPRWKGGITPLRESIRGSFKYRLWRSDVFTRDNFTCQECGKSGNRLNAHHTPKSFASILREYKIKTLQDALNCAELWNINNGKTLCEKCHNKIPKRIKNV